MSDASGDQAWHIRLVKPGVGRKAMPVRPADVAGALRDLLLAPESGLEDAQYQRIVPNRFIVELPAENYARRFQPLEQQICQQWRETLLNHLATTNSRQGQKLYRFAGQVQVEIRPAADLGMGDLRLRSAMQPDAPLSRAPATITACLELVPEGTRWTLREGVLTIGRDPGCAIALNLPRLLERPLISSRHAYVQCRAGECRLFDGSPDGVPSTNGTFVNGQPVPRSGRALQAGDEIILAALPHSAPNLSTPGVAGLRFSARCE
jgi:hypothetical protein